MARENFEDKLLQLKNQVLLMSEMAKIALNQAVYALDNQDTIQAQTVIDQDQKINELEDEINNYAIWLIAKEQPVAKDLRQLVTTLNVTTDIERIGDLAVNIAKAVKNIDQQQINIEKKEIVQMAVTVEKMIDVVIEAFFHEDIDKALSVAEMDDEVDKKYSETISQMLHYMADNRNEIGAVTQLAFISRYLERVADHVTNISESIIYLVKGKYVDLN